MKILSIKENIKSHKKSFFNVSFYFGASLLKAVVSLAINPLVALNMTHYDYALTGYFTSFNILFLPLMGLMFVQYFSKEYFKSDELQREKMKSTFISAQLLFGLIELIFIFIGFSIYARWQKIEFPVYPYALLAFGSIIFNNTYSFLLLIYKLKKEAKQFFKISAYNIILSTALVLIFVVLLKMGAKGKLLAPFLTALTFGIIAFFKVVKKISIDKKILHNALHFCWPLILAGSLGFFFKGIDRSMLLKLDDIDTLGLYNIAVGFAAYLFILQTSIYTTFQPDIYKAVAENNKKKIIKVVAGINLLYCIPTIIFIIFAPLIIALLTAGRFTEAYPFARILALQNLTSGLYYSFSSVITAYGYSKVTLINKIIGTIISIAIFKYLIGHYEFYGAAWGQVLSFLGMALISLFFIFYKIIINKIKCKKT